ncbi:MAG: nuclear transport factor 2 family protein [Myxococcota bacterium]
MDMPATTGERIQEIFERFGPELDAALIEAEPMYHPDMVFKDPLHTLYGREAFMEMNRRLMRRFHHIRFDIGERLESDHAIFLTWTMTMTSRLGPTLVVPGVTHIRLEDGLIVEHIDYWDILGSVMDSLPLLGPAYRSMMAQLG